ncbi:mannose-1-phosphate guanylyltransferase [Clostridium paraputrificum]|uniref:mannose-1-phosphate guanylyltransferase n=1 Tax=Clostridium paraputrificum TaxID=29363 RepID=UPI00356A0C81
MLCALIMAGGKGTRFWPLSTEEKPKQFLNLIGDKTMIQMTVDRILPIIPIERVFVCTGERYVDFVKEQLPNIPDRNIIVEPEGRNTAPCVALSAMIIKRYYKDSTMVVLASDHLIGKEEEFRNIILKSKEFLNDYTTAIVTLGMTPNRPETGYGYIEVGEKELDGNSIGVNRVNRFVEKPNKEKALEYLEKGNFLWNGGMFMWRVEGILSKVKEYMPSTYEALSGIEEVEDYEIQRYVYENYKNTEATSIDYGILEKSDEIYVVPSDINWDDIGSWDAMERYIKKDASGNIIVGKSKVNNAINNLIVSAGKKIIVDGVDNIYILECQDSILIGKKNSISDLRYLKESVGR